MIKYINNARWLLRVGLAFVLGYAAVEVQLSPENFLKYVPDFLNNFISVEKFLPMFAIGEGILVIWLLSGRHTEFPAILTALLMVGIVIFNLDAFQILFRNVAIGFSAIALVFLDRYAAGQENYKSAERMPDIKIQ